MEEEIREEGRKGKWLREIEIERWDKAGVTQGWRQRGWQEAVRERECQKRSQRFEQNIKAS